MGGAIREIALGREPRDWDLALSDADDLARLEESSAGSPFSAGKPIQTHRLVAGETVIDITILEEASRKTSGDRTSP